MLELVQGRNTPDHPDNETNDVPLSRESVVGGPMGLPDSDEPVTEPTQEELDSVEDVPEDDTFVDDEPDEPEEKPAPAKAAPPAKKAAAPAKKAAPPAKKAAAKKAAPKKESK